MKSHKYLALIFTTLALGFGAVQALAQPGAPAEASSAALSPLAKKGGPPDGCKNGQGMGCTTNEMRWRAAAHNADHHSDDVRKNNGKDEGKGKGKGKGK